MPAGPSGTLSAKGRQTRPAIEQASWKLFAENGFHGTTLGDTTSAAGRSPNDDAIATLSRIWNKTLHGFQKVRLKEITVDFSLPDHLPGLLDEMDAFIEAEIKPLEREHIQYFDHRREHARTDWDNGGIPRREWEDLLGEMRRRADKGAGCATVCRRSSAAETATISTWR